MRCISSFATFHLVSVLAVGGGAPARAAIIYVSAAAGGANDGTSCQDALVSLQSALAAAQPGDEIRVAEGTYMPDGGYKPVGGAHVPGSGDRTASFQLASGVAIYGGYPSTCDGDSFGPRDPDQHVTILSGDLADDDSATMLREFASRADDLKDVARGARRSDDLDGDGTVGDKDFLQFVESGHYDNNSHHVVNATGVDDTALLDGVTVTAGVATGASVRHGGGILADPGSPTLNACVVRNNTAGVPQGAGGGIYGCDGPINNCVIQGNTAFDGGGLAFCDGVISECVVADNVCKFGVGGGLFDCGGAIAGCTIRGNGGPVCNGAGGLYDCDGEITGCLIAGGDAQLGGGLVSCDGLISDCVIVGNSASNAGGGLDSCGGILRRCVISANRAGTYGGGGLNVSPASIVNCVISGNAAGFAGGGLRECDGALTNSVVSGNAAESGSALWQCDGPVTNSALAFNGSAMSTDPGLVECLGPIRNSIIWANTPDQLASSSIPTFSCIQDWAGGGTGNIADDPLFIGGDGGTWTGDGSFDGTTYQTTLTDAAAAWAVGELVGKLVNPDGAQPLQFVIAANTATTVTVWGDASSIAQSGDGYTVFDYHVQLTSPCVDAGDDSALPADVADLDGDGDSAEVLPIDFDGQPRVLGVLDMGAYELAGSMPAGVVARKVFYHDSYYDTPSGSPAVGCDAHINGGQPCNEDSAIAADKQALLPGGGTATFANYISYSKGINGIIIDIAERGPACGPITAGDFIFTNTGRDGPGMIGIHPFADVPAAVPASVITRTGEGVNGSDRVVITWDNPNGATGQDAQGSPVPWPNDKNAWLKIDVLDNGNTCVADTFYFGIAQGEGNIGNMASVFPVSAGDQTATRDCAMQGAGACGSSLTNPRPVTDPLDYDRNGVISQAADFEVARQNPAVGSLTQALRVFTP